MSHVPNLIKWLWGIGLATVVGGDHRTSVLLERANDHDHDHASTRRLSPFANPLLDARSTNEPGGRERAKAEREEEEECKVKDDGRMARPFLRSSTPLLISLLRGRTNGEKATSMYIVNINHQTPRDD